MARPVPVLKFSPSVGTNGPCTNSTITFPDSTQLPSASFLGAPYSMRGRSPINLLKDSWLSNKSHLPESPLIYQLPLAIGVWVCQLEYRHSLVRIETFQCVMRTNRRKYFRTPFWRPEPANLRLRPCGWAELFMAKSNINSDFTQYSPARALPRRLPQSEASSLQARGDGAGARGAR
jgi:hypothetical protein